LGVLKRLVLWIVIESVVSMMAMAQTAFGPDVQQYIKVSDPTFALTHVRVIDGTGAPAREDQTVVVANGTIEAIQASSAAVAKGVKSYDCTGYSVFPGIVGMHNHLYYSAAIEEQAGATGKIEPPGFMVAEIAFTAPRLYLAAGVTTMRTTGSIEPYTDLRVKHQIDSGQMPGPKIDASAPYLEGKGTFIAQLQELTGPEDARRTVAYWASEGMTSYKAYMFITRAELGAAIQEAHARKQKLTGHLCSVTWPEAIELGIDDLEHGPVFADTEFAASKKPDECPGGGEAAWAKKEVASAQALIQNLISHHVAVTSTLPVFETSVPGRPVLQPRVLEAMSSNARASYLARRARVSPASKAGELMKKEMEFELAFAKAGGLLLGGPDPTGNGGVLPGFGDQREIELLVEAGFTPLQAIQIATQNGAKYLGREDSVGTLAAGKQADIVLVKGDPSKNIADIENVETVFKDGVGYDSKKLIEAVRGQVGVR
jgi:imidazolonepropionase-like amidohydrolase